MQWFGLNFVEYWRSLRRRWPIALLVTAVTVAAVFVWTYRQPKIYESRCTIVIDPSAPQVLSGVKEVVELGSGSSWAFREFMETQHQILRSREIAQRVVDQLGLASDPTYPAPGAPKGNFDRAKYLSEQIRVISLKDSRITSIVVADRDPNRAARIANAVAAVYIESNLDYKLDGARSAANWLGEQMVDLKQRLAQSEMKVYEYRRAKQLLDVNLDTRQSMTTQNVQTYNQKLADLRARRIELESNRKLILQAKDNIDEQESLPDIRQNPIVQQLRVMFVDLAKRLAEMETTYGEKHPRIDALRRQINTVQKDYVSEIEKILKANDKAYQALLETEKALLQLMNQEKREAIELAKLEVEYKPLAREAEETHKLYSLVTQRQKETGLTGLIKTNNVRLLDSARPVPAPVRPQPFINLSLGAIVGFLGGVIVCMGLQAMDNTVKTHDQAEGLLGAPVLGMVPVFGVRTKKKPTPKEQRERDLSVFRDPKSTTAEVCRSIRTNLLFISPDNPPRSIAVTSPGPQEGKTTTAIGLAITMAQAGVRVLLVDTDLRRPRIHRAFDVANTRGISSVIVGEETLESAIVRTEVPNLDVLPCGPTPPNPAELLHTQRFLAIMQECVKRYDRVIYDTPPMSAVTDPAVIGNLADGVILVVRAGHTTRDATSFSRRQLVGAKARVLGAIINQVDLSDRDYDYYYSSYYRKTYGQYYGPAEGKA